MQQKENPETSGAGYQQGKLAGSEIRGYLLNRHRTCAYCGAKETPLQVEQIHPKASGESKRISNLALACGPCNQKKGPRGRGALLCRDQKRLERTVAQGQA
jgi:5-methylcytosine-specific restriction endonuclease McrA